MCSSETILRVSRLWSFPLFPVQEGGGGSQNFKIWGNFCFGVFSRPLPSCETLVFPPLPPPRGEGEEREGERGGRRESKYFWNLKIRKNALSFTLCHLFLSPSFSRSPSRASSFSFHWPSHSHTLRAWHLDAPSVLHGHQI